MTRRVAPRASCGAAALASLLALAGAPAHAGSLVVRDGDDNGWTVNEDPQADANDFVLRHLIHGAQPDERYGRNGQTTFTLATGNDAPASVRVDAQHRIWIDHIDADLFLRAFQSEAAGEMNLGTLGCAVSGCIRRSGKAVLRGDEDDVAADLLLLEQLEGFA